MSRQQMRQKSPLLLFFFSYAATIILANAITILTNDTLLVVYSWGLAFSRRRLQRPAAAAPLSKEPEDIYQLVSWQLDIERHLWPDEVSLSAVFRNNPLSREIP